MVGNDVENSSHQRVKNQLYWSDEECRIENWFICSRRIVAPPDPKPLQGGQSEVAVATASGHQWAFARPPRLLALAGRQHPKETASGCDCDSAFQLKLTDINMQACVLEILTFKSF